MMIMPIRDRDHDDDEEDIYMNGDVINDDFDSYDVIMSFCTSIILIIIRTMVMMKATIVRKQLNILKLGVIVDYVVRSICSPLMNYVLLVTCLV